MKNKLRKWAKETRSSLDITNLSLVLVNKLKQCEEYKNAKTIMIFYPKGDEINLLSLLEDKSKNFYLPKIDGNNLLCCPYKKGENLCLSCFNTQEPTTNPKNITPDLIIIPALAVDKNNYRLGYGKGFYDRFLKDKTTKKIVCIPSSLIVETIYPNDFDIPVDKVITE